jgi:hypothetical protein
LNVDPALPAIEPRSTSPLNTSGCLRAFGSSGIDLGRINIIADAMYHTAHVSQLRMNVNNFATHSQKHLQLRLFGQ